MRIDAKPGIWRNTHMPTAIKKTNAEIAILLSNRLARMAMKGKTDEIGERVLARVQRAAAIEAMIAESLAQ